MNWHKSLLILLLTFLAHITVASDPYYLNLFEQANNAYKAGAYDSAKTYYNEILQNGLESPELLFNLGNTHFKQDNLAAAILFYERARRLNPKDEDITYNLDIARNLTVDKIESLEQPFFIDWWNGLALSLRTSTWSILYFMLLCLTALLLTFFFISKTVQVRQLGLLGGVAAFAGAIVLYFLASQSHQLLNRDQAIVFAATVSVKSEPGLNATDQFVLHEGIKVDVLGEEGDWTRIELPDGNSGWLQSESIESI